MKYGIVIKNEASPYKYNLKRLGRKFRQTTSKSERELMKEFQISWTTYWKDKNLMLTDKSSIPEARLQIYALAFKVSPLDVLNYRIVPSLKSKDYKLSEGRNWLVLKYGLEK